MGHASLCARVEVRRHMRTLARHPEDLAAHLARVHAALQLNGVEPVQGALADLFGSLGPSAAALKAAALQMAAPRLGPRLVGRFNVWVAAPALPRVTSLATRWSFLTSPSADVAIRVRRCSADDSRSMAAQALVAYEQQNLPEQAQFLHHCLTCEDRLAFMLVRRELLKHQACLPADWAAVEAQLLGAERDS